jgi:hypothetical protein
MRSVWTACCRLSPPYGSHGHFPRPECEYKSRKPSRALIGMLALLLPSVHSQNTQPPVGLGEICGGLLDIACQQGLACEFPPQTVSGSISDEQGRCVPATVSILPISDPLPTSSSTAPTSTRLATLTPPIATLTSTSAPAATSTRSSAGQHGLCMLLWCLLL